MKAPPVFFSARTPGRKVFRRFFWASIHFGVFSAWIFASPPAVAQEDLRQNLYQGRNATARQMDDAGIVVLRTIDKVSARTRTFEIPVDKTVKFGASLFIKVSACRKASPLERPESAAFLQIWERKPEEEKPHWVFSGWMFASNPALSAMDHPVYDVWVIDCKNPEAAPKPEEFSSEATPAAPASSETPVVAPEELGD